MAPQRVLWLKWWTVRKLSHAVQEVCHRLIILGFGLKGATVDRPRILCLRSRGLAVCQIVPALQQGLNVGVGSGFVHAVILQGQAAGSGGRCATCQTVHQSNKTPPRVCNLEGGRGGKGAGRPLGLYTLPVSSVVGNVVYNLVFNLPSKFIHKITIFTLFVLCVVTNKL